MIVICLVIVSCILVIDSVVRTKNKKKEKGRDRQKRHRFVLMQETKQWIWGILMMVATLLVSLSFFGKAGVAGDWFMRGARWVAGETVFITPLIFAIAGLVFLTSRRRKWLLPEPEKKVFLPVLIATILVFVGVTGLLDGLGNTVRRGGWLGYLIAFPFLKYFGFLATQIILVAPILIGAAMFWHYLLPVVPKKQKTDLEAVEKDVAGSVIKRIFAPRFKVKEVPSFEGQEPPPPKPAEEVSTPEPATPTAKPVSLYPALPLELLEKDREVPTSGDTKMNSAIIQKTLQNFGIDVTMSEVSIGPTVTQYTFKPAEGVKLAKITALSNDLSLALASHPIRIEAPIPGRPLVGVELPNKGKALVRLRNLIESPHFQQYASGLMLSLGRDVSGTPVYADLAKMPHLLVAGSTGTGKTIFLNSLILNLLYQPSIGIKSGGPDFLRLILIDPKRVEFSVYNGLPHLLCPVIYNAQQTVNALQWLIGEMERRFDVLAEVEARDIGSFNEKALKSGKTILPFIVVIIDELADLMSAKGREIEALIVRLAQMARAVGIHLVVATQRPSVEVITGLIKANITSRITFQVASQVDSRTVLDAAGAEKLLGAGDMLYLSAQSPKPKRVQAAYIGEKEIKKVIHHIATKITDFEPKAEMKQELVEALERGTAQREGTTSSFYDEEDPLYEEAKAVVIEAKKGSASLLQRRLKLGYARAARLIDMLEENGVIGPGEGAKPREVYEGESSQSSPSKEDDSEWKKI